MQRKVLAGTLGKISDEDPRTQGCSVLSSNPQAEQRTPAPTSSSQGSGTPAPQAFPSAFPSASHK